jgi:hypothetical protein
MQTADKYFRFIKERPLLFDGGHKSFTPSSITDPLISKLDFTNREVLVLYNIEFVISLIYTHNISPGSITFFADHINKVKIAKSLGVKYETNLDAITMKSRPVLLVNPPYTNGEQDASEIYTSIINNCIDKFNPIAIGGVTPENLMNGGQKKKSLRDKILKKYGLKELRFLDQRRDWTGKIKVDTVFWVVEDGYSGSTSVTSRYHTVPYIVPNKLDEYIDGATQDVHDWLLNIQTNDKIKLKAGDKTSTAGSQIKISKDQPDGWMSENGHEYTSHNTEWRVAFGYMRCNTCAVVPPGESIPGKYRYMNFSSEANARKFAAYMMSEPVRFIMKLVYTSRTLDNPQLAYVPLLDMNKFPVMTDQALYQYWNVTPAVQTEIANIVGNEVPF